ncbi:hypothetical protein Cgig2_012845 [Carnegiea gigantea]|uniref:Uncharacterized protein n=1 Tax=Carnegiea gigantea TaxID=171969 RepID=A0A9Q1K8Q8_9CARY|nr:hypothetical protein Cgig2_012845 [Carnegiea gigantea]
MHTHEGRDLGIEILGWIINTEPYEFGLSNAAKNCEIVEAWNGGRFTVQNPNIGAWADNLIVSSLTEKVIPSGNSSKSQPKVTANRSDKLTIRRPRPRAAKQPITPLQIDEASHCTLIKSKSSYFLKGLHDFDVHSLCQPQIGEIDCLIENFGQADDEDSDHDDSEDSDFREWQADGFEESDSFSLDEKDDLKADNESLDDIN